MRKGHGEYPEGWREFAHKVKEEAGWKCIRCHHIHEPSTGYCLTVHHVTMNKAEPFEHWWAFLALCQRCHLHIQSKVVMERIWYLPHSEWFKPFAGGYFAYRYLGLNLSRDEVMENLEYYANLQRSILLGESNGDSL